MEIKLKKFRSLTREAMIMLAPERNDVCFALPGKNKKGEYIDQYNWFDVKTKDRAFCDSKHPFVLTWLVTVDNESYTYKQAVSYNYLVEHFYIDIPEGQLIQQLSYKHAKSATAAMLKVIEKHDEYFYGTKIDPEQKSFSFMGKEFSVNRFENNGRGDWIAFPYDRRNRTLDIDAPVQIDGVDFDCFYSLSLPTSEAKIDTETGKYSYLTTNAYL